MNFFLVLARCGEDDLPMKLFRDPDNAREYASKITPSQVFAMADMVYDLDTSIAHAVSVVEFNVEGIPVGNTHIISFD